MHSNDQGCVMAVMKITAEHVAEMRRLKGEGKTYRFIAAQLGCSEYTVSRYIEDDRLERRQQREAARDSRRRTKQAEPARLRPDEAARALDRVKPDTRDWKARFFGDPGPGRSALDKKRMVSA